MQIAKTQTWCGLMLALLLVMGGFVLFMTPASAAEYHGFVKNQWYLGKGGKVVSLKDFAANPRKYLRSEAAYSHLRHHMAGVVGKPSLSDAEFRQLLSGNNVRLVACTGRIKTAGIANGGQVGWKDRNCYKGEYLIEVLVSGNWTVAASQACYNSVEGLPPLLPIPKDSATPLPVAPPVYSSPPETRKAGPTPPAGRMVCYPVQFSQPVDSGTAQYLSGFHLDSCCCGEGIVVPSYSFRIEGSVKSAGSTEKCEWVPN